MELSRYYYELLNYQEDIIKNIDYIASSASCLTRIYHNNYGNFVMSLKDHYERYFDEEDTLYEVRSILDSVNPNYGVSFEKFIKAKIIGFNAENSIKQQGNIEDVINMIKSFFEYTLTLDGLDKQVAMKSYEIYAIKKLEESSKYEHDASLYFKRMVEKVMEHASMIVGIATHLDMYRRYKSDSSLAIEKYNNETLYGISNIKSWYDISKYANEVMVLSLSIPAAFEPEKGANIVNSANHFQKVLHYMNDNIKSYGSR